MASAAARHRAYANDPSSSQQYQQHHQQQQQQQHQQQYLSANHGVYQTYAMHSPDSAMGDEDDELESEVAEPGAALQYWTASRHKTSSKGKNKADEEYCMSRAQGR